MADGGRLPISEVAVGDEVLATNPVTGETGPRKVLATLPHTDDLLMLSTSAGDIVTIEDHRFWNATDQAWQESQHLDPGDRLHSADGEPVMARGLDWSTVHTGTAYDLTIADLHTFYVAAGETSVLVHNCDIGAVLSASRNFNRGQRTSILDQGTASAEWKHIFDRHVDVTKFADKSKFPPTFSEADVISLLNMTLKHGKESSYAGNAVFEFRTNFKNSGHTTFRATVLPDGRVQTFHPLG
jgi:hypothetical protein